MSEELANSELCGGAEDPTDFLIHALDALASRHSATGSALGRMNLHNVYAGRQLVAGLDEAGKIDALSRLTGFANTESGRTQVMVQQGDTLYGLAQRVYGNGNLWYVIAEANGLLSDADLVAGTSVTVPEVKTSSNDASTFKPYNPSETTGPTTPGLPYIQPPPKSGCGTLGMIIMVVVIIVVSIYTAGAASGAAAGAGTGAGAGAGAAAGTATAGTAAAGTAAAGTAAASTSVWGAGVTAFAGGGTVMSTGTAILSAGVGAFAGSVAGQAVGSAMGVTSFSWRNALVSGATAMATAGLGAAIQGGQLGRLGAVLKDTTWAKAAAGAVVGNATSYAASKSLGMECWRRLKTDPGLRRPREVAVCG